MSATTERRIERLSAEALTAETQEDVDRILEELRATIQEHLRLAKNKLRSQANSFD
jgi:F0F1-type ATP synthase membrane subunit b/b'